MVGPKWLVTFLAAKCCGTFEETSCDTLLGCETELGPKRLGKLAGTLKLVGGAGLDAGGRGACLAIGERPGGGSKGIGTLGKAAIGGAGGEGVLCRWSAGYDGGGGGKYSGRGNEAKGPWVLLLKSICCMSGGEAAPAPVDAGRC